MFHNPLFQKILQFLGAIFLVLLIILGLAWGYFSLRERSLDASSKVYAEQAVPAIFGSWNANELINRANPTLLASLSKDSAAQKIFDRLRALGTIKAFSGCTGKAGIHLSIHDRSTIATAAYLCNVDFSNSPAGISLLLVDDPDKGWQVYGMHVDSKLFQQQPQAKK